MINILLSKIPNINFHTVIQSSFGNKNHMHHNENKIGDILLRNRILFYNNYSNEMGFSRLYS